MSITMGPKLKIRNTLLKVEANKNFNTQSHEKINRKVEILTTIYERLGLWETEEGLMHECLNCYPHGFHMLTYKDLCTCIEYGNVLLKNLGMECVTENTGMTGSYIDMWDE